MESHKTSVKWGYVKPRLFELERRHFNLSVLPFIRPLQPDEPEMFGMMEPDGPQKLREDFIQPLMKEPIHLYTNNQFAYWVIHTGKPFVSVWALLFYGTLPFIGFTGSKVNVTNPIAS